MFIYTEGLRWKVSPPFRKMHLAVRTVLKVPSFPLSFARPLPPASPCPSQPFSHLTFIEELLYLILFSRCDQIPGRQGELREGKICFPLGCGGTTPSIRVGKPLQAAGAGGHRSHCNHSADAEEINCVLHSLSSAFQVCGSSTFRVGPPCFIPSAACLLGDFRSSQSNSGS